MKPSAIGRSWRAWLGGAAWIVAVGLIAVHLFVPARQATTVALDDSNYTSYAYFTAHGFQYGPEVVPAVGPLGFVLYGDVYGGDLFWTRFALDLVFKLGFAALVLALIARSRQRVYRWVWAAIMLLITPLIGDASFDFAILLSGIFLLTALERERPSRFHYAAAAFLALLALLKGTEFALAVLTAGLLIVAAIAQGRTRSAFRLLGVMAGAFLVFWIGAHQNPLHIPSYIRGVLELSAGYNDAMSVQESPAVFRVGITVLLLLAAALVLAIAGRWRERATVAALLLVGGYTFVIWKHGFVRADGHVMIFFWYAIAIAATVVLLGAEPTSNPPGSRRWVRVLLGAAMWLAAAIAIVGGGYATGRDAISRLRWEISQLPHRFGQKLSYIGTVSAQKARIEQQLADHRARYALTHTANIVGGHSIDFFGSEHGFLRLNRLRYQPRPMGGGSFCVYTPYLERMNEAFLRDPTRRPEFVLTNLGTIDDRLLAQDDARSLLALLHGYVPVDTEQGMLLLRAKPAANGAREQFTSEQAFALNEWVEVPPAAPGRLTLASFDIPRSLRGGLRAFLYKSPMLHIDFEGDGLAQPAHRRFVPGMVRLPLLFNPVLEANADLLALYGGAAEKRIRRFRLTTESPELFAPRLRVRFFGAPAPTALPAADFGALRERLKFPVAETAPIHMKPANAPLRNFDGFLVQMIDPPAEIAFALHGDERRVAFDLGIDPEAYERGETDGVEFIVDVVQGGAIRQRVFSRLLQPKTVPTDRGRHAANVLLPPLTPHSTLELRTMPGPHGNGAWDWGYVSKIRFERGAYTTEQFAGFKVAPARIENPSPGGVATEEGTVFMLNSPSLLEFALSGAEHQLELTIGFLPGAYSNGGNSDGVNLIVELSEPDGTAQPLMQRRLNPRDEPADRGRHAIRVPLPPHTPGARLLVRTDEGPAHDPSWDWTYLSSLDIK